MEVAREPPGFFRVAAGVKALVKGSRHRKPETTIDTRRMAVARREADLVKALERTTDAERARRLTRDLHACRLHLRSLEFEAAARARLC